MVNLATAAEWGKTHEAENDCGVGVGKCPPRPPPPPAKHTDKAGQQREDPIFIDKERGGKVLD